MSRQTQRSEARIDAKAVASSQKRAARVEAQRALLSRQSRRETEGFYEGRSVGQNLMGSRSRLNKRVVKKGQPFGRIIRKFGIWALHATKGWRLA